MHDEKNTLKSAMVVEGGIVLTWVHGLASPLGNYWLRDNCHCAQCRHPGNGQKLYEIDSLASDLHAQEAWVSGGSLLQVTWSDAHQSRYTHHWLASHDLSSTAHVRRQHHPKLWGNELAQQLPIMDWLRLVEDEAAELAWLERYAALGFGVLKNVPLQLGMVAEVGDRLGHVRVTNYGRYFDVKSVPNPTNLAYTSVGLGVHSDNPYRHPAPGVQLLHCLESQAPGGDTLLVDGFHAAALLRREDPTAFKLLTELALNFRFRDANTELCARQTLISLDAQGVVTAVHFNNRSADWLDAPAELAEPWYGAYIQFAHILKRPELELVLRLAPGDCLVMQNDRTLHGRTAFDPNLGRRHLQGCYIDRDGLESRRQVLKRTQDATP